jgi:divalent metal cation (Fe/Co/Zn/Cd) transporter
MLFTVGAAFSVYEGIHKITNPEEIRSPLIAFVVLALSFVLEGFSLRTAIGEANKVRGGRNWGTFIRRSKAPELPVVLLEDLAALIGLTFAFAGVALSVLTGDGRWDGVGSLAIGLLLGTAAAILAVEMKSLLIGESASPEVQRMIADSILVAAKVEVRDADTTAQVAAAIDTAERRVRSAVPIAKTIYLEPDIYHAAKADASDPAIRAVQRSHSPVPPAGGGPMKPGNPENPAPEPSPPE